MKYEEIKNAIHSIHAGTYANMTTCKTLKTRKEFKDKNIVKISRSTIRAGVEYDIHQTGACRWFSPVPEYWTSLRLVGFWTRKILY